MKVDTLRLERDAVALVVEDADSLLLLMQLFTGAGTKAELASKL